MYSTFTMDALPEGCAVSYDSKFTCKIMALSSMFGQVQRKFVIREN